MARQDRDRDGVDDEEEQVYKTNPDLLDTDGDYYSDGEEINHGWNPLDKSPSPGQSERTESPANTEIIIQRESLKQKKEDYSLLS